MFHKVKDVKAMPNYELLVSFETGEKKRYLVQPLFDIWDDFKTLKTVEGLFELARVDAGGGYGICWNEDIDLACDELWENGECV